MLLAGWEKPAPAGLQISVLARQDDRGAPEPPSLLPAHSYFITTLTARALGANRKVGGSWFKAAILILHFLAGKKEGKEFPISIFLTACAQTCKKDRNNEFGPQSSLH